jgi:hypothetical protein
VERERRAHLDREGGLSDTTVSQHDQLVQRHFARHGEGECAEASLWIGEGRLRRGIEGEIRWEEKREREREREREKKKRV